MGWKKKANLKGAQGLPGERGLPGVNAIENDAAVAAYISTASPSATKDALDAGYARLDTQLPIDPTGKLLRSWRAAAANAGQARANVLVIGDSIGEGAWADTYFDGFVHVLRKYLQTEYAGTLGGEGFIPTIRGFNGLAHGQPGMADQWEFTGSPTIVRDEANISGLGRRSLTISPTQSASHTFFGDRFRLHFTGWSTAPNAKITIDGGTPVLVPTDNPENISGIPWTSPALTRGQHTVKVEGTTGSVVLDGGCFWDGDYAKGVTMWDGSHSSFRTDHFFGQGAPSSASSRWSHAMIDLNPHLVIIELGINDEHQPESGTYTPEIYGERLGLIVDLIRTRANGDPSIVFLLQPVPGAGGGEAWWMRHRAAAIATAKAKGVALVDLLGVVNRGPDDDQPTKLYFNANHPNSAGHRAYAQAIAAQLGVGAAIAAPASTTFHDGGFNITNTSASDYSGPEISSTIEVPESGRVLVTISSRIGASAGAAYLAFDAVGSTNFAASGTKAIRSYDVAPNSSTRSLSVLLEGLTPGVTKFRARPFVASGTGSYNATSIVAEPK